MRLIDADALRLMKVEECKGHTIDYAAGWKACIDWIKTFEPIDAVPVVHGRWYPRATGLYMCSECKALAPYCSFNYCRECGAKMDR